MLTLSKRGSRIRMAILCGLIIATMAAMFNHLKQTITGATAITEDGEVTTITRDFDNNGQPVTIYYSRPEADGHGTAFFRITTSAGTFLGFCRNPDQIGPDRLPSGGLPTQSGYTGIASRRLADSDVNNKIKLLVYIGSSNSQIAQNALDTLFPDVPEYNRRYGFIHATLGYLSEGRVDFGELNADGQALVIATADRAQTMINNNADAWVAAKNYRLYGLDTSDFDTSTYQDIVWVEPDPEKGNIRIIKCDEETGCGSNGAVTQGSASLQGITISVTNTVKVFEIVDGVDTVHAPGEYIKTYTTDRNGTVSASNLPVGTYEVKETGTHASYLLDAAQVTVTFGKTETKTVTLRDHVKRGDVKFRKMNDTTNSAMANIPFRITSDTTGENHIVVTNSNGIVDTSAIAHTNNTNGYDSIANIENITYRGYGTWFGLKEDGTQVTPDDNRGALPYDSYTITELRCNNNEHCIDIENQVKHFTIDSDSVTVDLHDWENDCGEFSLDTTAKDGADNDKYVEATSTARIVDTISYCVADTGTYTIKGTLMDKSTGQPLTINGATFTETVTISSDSGTVDGATRCGTTDMVFRINASDIAGKKLVVFETIYDEENAPVIAHEDINDDDQSVDVISLSTYATSGKSGTKNLVAEESARIVDRVDYCFVSGETFTIKGILYDKTSGEPLRVNNQTIEQETTVTPTSADGCGQTTMTYNLNALGLSGRDIVIYDTVYHGSNLIMAHENPDNADETVTVTDPGPVFSLDTSASDDYDGDKFVEVDEMVKIRDVVDYCVAINTAYTLRGILMDKETGEPLEIDGETIEASVQIPAKATGPVNPPNYMTRCDSAEMIFELDASDIAGKRLVVFESIYEGEDEIISHEDIDDDDQSVDMISLSTFATNGKDGTKKLVTEETSEIVDRVDYCLVEGRTFVINGILIDKESGDEILVDDEPVTESVTITPDPGESCGSVEMVYTLDTLGFGGKDIVIYNEVYLGDDLILAHTNPDNADQTVSIVTPPPDTGIFTGAIKSLNEGNPFYIVGAASVIIILGFATKRYISHKNAVNFR